MHVAFMTSGESSHQNCCSISKSTLQSRRESESRKALQILGVPELNAHFLRLPDGGLPHLAQVGFEESSVQLSDLIRQIEPHSVFAPHPFEGWSDHLAAEELSRVALAQAKGHRGWSPSRVAFYHYCVWFWFSMPLRRALRVGWHNAVTLDIRPVWNLKQQAIRTYLDDLAPCGKPTCGVLSQEFLHAFKWKKELFFRVPGLGSA